MDHNVNIGTGTPVTDPGDLEGIEAMLGELEIENGGETETITEITEGEVGAIEALEALEKAHETTEVSTAGVSEEAPAAPAKEKKARTPKEKKERAPRDLNALPAELFILSDETPADLEANKTSVIGNPPTQKKIAEKFENLFQSIAAGRRPSVYTMACFDVLSAKGTVTQGDLVAALKASNSKKGTVYDEGTARSQAGQMMALFAHVGIAKREKNTLTYVTTSPLAAKLKALPSV